MKTKKMSLANIQGKLSRTEMKNIMAGSGSDLSCDYEFECIVAFGDNCFCLTGVHKCACLY